MNNEQILSVLRDLFTGLQAETVNRYAKAGIYNEIKKEKMELSMASGKINAQMLEVIKPEQAFTKPASIVDCASWKISSNRNALTAVCAGCKLVDACKELETSSPCRMYCLNPIEGMLKALKPKALFNVKSTLWSEKNCTVEVTW